MKGTDGNAIADECNLETPAGAAINFNIHEAVSANFNYQVKEGCRYDTVQYFNALENGQKNWNWQFDNSSSIEQNPSVVYSSFGYKKAQLIVSNGLCSDTAFVNVYLDHDNLKAAFNMPSVLCPEDLANFKDTSTGKINSWFWQFGNGITSSLQNPPPQVYSPVNSDRLLPVRLIVQNDKACYDTTTQYLKLLNSCYIAVPTAFTPNHDGRNDYLYPLNAYETTNLEFKVYNRNGQLLFSTTDWTHKWDGTFNNEEQPTGVYTWFLQYTSTETGKSIFQKGTTVLIR
jgi:gliding motility-associated-like protein